MSGKMVEFRFYDSGVCTGPTMITRLSITRRVTEQHLGEQSEFQSAKISPTTKAEHPHFCTDVDRIVISSIVSQYCRILQVIKK